MQKLSSVGKFHGVVPGNIWVHLPGGIVFFKCNELFQFQRCSLFGKVSKTDSFYRACFSGSMFAAVHAITFASLK